MEDMAISVVEAGEREPQASTVKLLGKHAMRP
jgi:hypothetical protein